MTTTWFKEFKDAMYTAKSFIQERKKGKHTEEEDGFLNFIDHLFTHEVEVIEQLSEGFKRMITDPENLKLMKTGLCLKHGETRTPGKFWVKDNVFVIIQDNDFRYEMNFKKLLRYIAGSPVLPPNTKTQKPSDVMVYVTSCLSKSITLFITQKTELLVASDRSDICKNTHASDINPPYSGKKGELVLGIADKMLNLPIADTLCKAYAPAGFQDMAKKVVKKADMSMLAELQGSLTEVAVTGDLDSVGNVLKKGLAKLAANINAESDNGKHCCDQD